MAEFLEVLRTRRSTRSYLPDAVPRETLQELVDLAILAPTGMNTQPWAFSVVTSREVLTRANAIVTAMIRAPEVLQRLPNDRMRQIVLDPAYDIFYGAPALVVISGRTTASSALVDCQLACENLFLAATARGLGTCYMGWLLMAADNPELAGLLRIPEGHRMMAAAIVGHPAERPEGPPQRSAAKIDWIG